MDLSFLPSPDKIPVNWLWFQILLIVTFFIHVILMNFILGGSILTLWDLYRGKNIRRDANSIPTLIALTINFGVPPLLFVQVLYGHLFYTSSLIIAVPWILVIPVLILAYYGAYIFVYRYERNLRLAKLSLTISTIFLLAIAFIYVNNITLSMTPERFIKYFDNPYGWNLNLSEPTLFPRYLHILVAAIAVAGLGRAVYYYFSKNMDPELKKEGINNGLKIFGYATMLQIVTGILFWFTLPREIGKLLIGGNITFTLLLAIGVTLAISLIMFAVRRKFLLTFISIIPLLIIMILVRDFVRRSYLADNFKPQQLENTGQSSSLILFLIVFVAGLFLIGYMINLMTVKPKPE